MLKKELRNHYLSLREKLTYEALTTASLKISNQLIGMPIWSYQYYHLFLQIPEKKEINTSYILSVLQGKDKNIVVPKIDTGKTFKNYLLTDNTLLRKSRWNIPEPVDGLEVPHHKIDVVFLPLLAFDRQGHRVGYGKGYYDTFLKSCRKEVLKIGLSVFEAEVEVTDIRAEDIAMDFCVTPEKIYSF